MSVMDMSSVDESSSSQATIWDMPMEILQMILEYVTEKDLLSLRQTCTYFRNEASHPRLLSLDMMDRTVIFDQLPHLSKTVAPIMPNIAAICFSGCEILDPITVPKLEENGMLDRKRIDLLKENFVRLKRLHLTRFIVTRDISISYVLPETLSFVKLSRTIFEDVESFFAPESCAKLSKSLLEFKLSDCEAACEGIAALSNLRVLCLSSIDNLTDENFVRLDGHLPNLIELQLMNMKLMGNQSFHMIGKNFRKLEVLVLYNCPFVLDAGFVALANNLTLKKLCVSYLIITDASLPVVIERLVNLRHVEFYSCELGNDTMNAICRGLPQLESLDISKNRNPIVDASFRDIVMHPHMNMLRLDNLKKQRHGISDIGIALLVPKMPNLTSLSIDHCSISDEGFQLIADTLSRLEFLLLWSTIITDYGLARNMPKLKALDKFDINSTSPDFTENGVLAVTDCLIRASSININRKEAFRVRYWQVECEKRKQFIAKKITTPALATKLLPAFTDIRSLNLKGVKLTVSDVDHISVCHPHLEKLIIMNENRRRVTNETVLAIMSNFVALQELDICNSSLKDATVLKMFDGPVQRSLHSLILMNVKFPSTRTILRITPFLNDMRLVAICTQNLVRPSKLAIVGETGGKHIIVVGRDINDKILHALFSSVQGVTALTMRSTSISLRGFLSVTPFLSNINRLELFFSLDKFTQVTADDVMSVFGNLETSNLKDLNITGESLTDSGLLLLGRHLLTLERLEVHQSLMTCAGIREIYARLSHVREVVFGHHAHQRMANILNRLIY